MEHYVIVTRETANVAKKGARPVWENIDVNKLFTSVQEAAKHCNLRYSNYIVYSQLKSGLKERKVMNARLDEYQKGRYTQHINNKEL